MTERASQLRGTLIADAPAGGTGTLVRATLPCQPSRMQGPDKPETMRPAVDRSERSPQWLP